MRARALDLRVVEVKAVELWQVVDRGEAGVGDRQAAKIKRPELTELLQVDKPGIGDGGYWLRRAGSPPLAVPADFQVAHAVNLLRWRRPRSVTPVFSRSRPPIRSPCIAARRANAASSNSGLRKVALNHSVCPMVPRNPGLRTTTPGVPPKALTSSSNRRPVAVRGAGLPGTGLKRS